MEDIFDRLKELDKLDFPQYRTYQRPDGTWVDRADARPAFHRNPLLKRNHQGNCAGYSGRSNFCGMGRSGKAACKDYGIPFYILRSNLYQDYMKNFGANRVSAMPFWTLNEEGKEGCIQRRACTVDYKIVPAPQLKIFINYMVGEK